MKNWEINKLYDQLQEFGSNNNFAADSDKNFASGENDQKGEDQTIYPENQLPEDQ